MRINKLIVISTILVASCSVLDAGVKVEQDLKSNIFLGRGSSSENYGIWIKTEMEHDSLFQEGQYSTLIFRNPDSVKVFNEYVIGYRNKKYCITYGDSLTSKIKYKKTQNKDKFVILDYE